MFLKDFYTLKGVVTHKICSWKTFIHLRVLLPIYIHTYIHIYIYQKNKIIIIIIIGVRKGCWNAHKMARNWLRRLKKYKNWNLIVYFWLMRAMLTKKIQVEEEKSKIKSLWTQLNFIKGLIEFMEGLIESKINF